MASPGVSPVPPDSSLKLPESRPPPPHSLGGPSLGMTRKSQIPRQPFPLGMAAYDTALRLFLGLRGRTMGSLSDVYVGAGRGGLYAECLPSIC